MSPDLLLKAVSDSDDLPRNPRFDIERAYRDRHQSAAAVALWLFMAVAGMLFSLFLAAYVMRMNSSDWSVIALPWQLQLSTALLFASGMAMQQAALAARYGMRQNTRLLIGAAALFALAFLLVQCWAWRVLLQNNVLPVNNPAGSFFYLLTAMHGVHVIGGMLALAWTAHTVWAGPQVTRNAWRLKLCARYWHFLLALWLVLFATLGWLTPDVVNFICGR